MLYRLFNPAPGLADVVVSYWYATIARNQYAKQHYGTPLFEGLVFNFTQLKEYVQRDGKTTLLTKEAYISGQVVSYTSISGCPENEGYIIGVRFKPLGLAKLTGINMVHLTNKTIDASEVWGKELYRLCEAMQEACSIEASIQVLECFLKEQRRRVHLHYRVESVSQAISLMQAYNGNISCKMLQEYTNTSRKTLERAFLNFHGMLPKVYLRIIRFNCASQMIDCGRYHNLAELAIGLGYFDESHFIKEFKRFSGQTPREYLKIMECERLKRTIPTD